ncbi:MAG: hypothetical protein M1818_004922 [Claussenomyces sp. TS43310]|nr:MAG: hypothetical protein M1818_004922 [Claussenomyces sp. TS43310]
MASKIIVIGGVNGQLRSAFTKLANLHAKNTFTLAIVAGDLFAEDDAAVSDILAGEMPIPLPTYFTVGMNALPQRVLDKLSTDADICENLHYLGKRSTVKTSEGIRIVTLGGQLDPSIVGGISKEQYLPFHTVDDAKTLRGANTADILLTTAWPAGIRTGSKVPMPDLSEEPSGYEHISDLCQALKPRYHFSSASQFFFEREPFFHTPTEGSLDRPLTRFISLAGHGNPPKQKSLYAFTLQSSPDLTAPLPAGTTASPFISKTTTKKRPALDSMPYSRFSNADEGYRQHKRSRRERGPPPGPDTCFFCLSNPNIGQHLIVSIGDDAYLTVAKGPLTTSTTNAAVGIEFPAHALIIPLAHEPTLALMPDKDSREKTYAEMKSFKSALQNMVSLRSANKLGAVTYEISRAKGVHTHWQFLPMPAVMVRKGLVEAAFRVEAENLSYPQFAIRDVGLAEDEGDFFRVWIWTPPDDDDDGNEGTTKSLLLPLDSDLRFDLQFGRRVLAKLLGLEKRLQWRDCVPSEDEEKAEVEAFKQAFKDFDFTT